MSYPKKYSPVTDWFNSQNWKPNKFQIEAWKEILDSSSGIVNAPTGSGKTYSVLGGAILKLLRSPSKLNKKGLKLIWISPIRALTEEISASAKKMISGLDLDLTVGVRTGDTDTKIKQAQKKNMPDILITTPESLHILFASKEYERFFKTLQFFIVDEWHELLGSKRAVQTELAISRLIGLNSKLQVWGISATIGNLDEALDVLLGNHKQREKAVLIRSKIKKKYKLVTAIPDEIEKYPWAGHYGTKLLPQIIPIIENSRSTLIFTNTRAQCEIWFQNILESYPEVIGQIAMHHGSIDKKTRHWVEQALHEERLKVVVCTSSLDLGVDFRPVETVIQIGGPKGVARFMQRAGRAGHKPGEVSKIFFLPTHAIELVEAAGLREAIDTENIESRDPYFRSFDVLVQYLVTLAVSDGFYPEDIYKEIIDTYSFSSISEQEWNWVLSFSTLGGQSLNSYDEFKRVEIIEDGRYKVLSNRVRLRHRLSIGTIVSDAMVHVRFMGGGRLGVIEEWFVSKLNPGDVFWFSGRALEFIQMKEMTAYVKRSKSKNAKVPAYMGGRMSLSSNMSELLRKKIYEASSGNSSAIELKKVKELLDQQKKVSKVPSENQLLIEYTKTREGYHLWIYPFEGRNVHEGISSLLAWRISQIMPISFSIAFNDYGFELLSATKIDPEIILNSNLLTPENLSGDLSRGINATEMAKRKFRDIAVISGLTFSGFPGKFKTDKHLQSSSSLIFDVLNQYEPDSLLLKQAYEEVYDYQIQEPRLRKALKRIEDQEIIFSYPEKPSPFSFPILADRLREKLSSEKLSDRLKKMQIQFAK